MMRFARSLPALAVLLLAAAAIFVIQGEHSSIDEAHRTLATRLASKGLRLGDPVFIRTFKAESEFELWMKADDGWKLFQTYPICRWSGGLGPKLRSGDKQAPEGFYRIGLSQLNPNSRRYRSFNVGYPNAFDRAHGRTGTHLMVHGGCSSTGCYAMTDAQVDDIYRLVESALVHGQKSVDMHAFPFRMTAANMALHSGNRWIGFWRDLKAGYDLFEASREVPAAGVRNGRYVVFAANERVARNGVQPVTAWR